MTLKYPGIDYAKLAEVIREELPPSRGLFTAKTYNIGDLESIFYSIFYNTDEGVYRVGELNRYWSWGWDPNLGDWGKIDLPTPREHSFLCAYTKDVYSYPHGSVLTKLPDRTLISTGALFPFGFEAGPIGLMGLIAFQISSDKNFYAQVGGKWGSIGDNVRIDLTSELPADYTTALHLYEIKVNRMNAEFYIDKVLKAVVLTGVPLATISGPPYAIAGIASKISSKYPAFIELAYTNLGPYELSPVNLKVFDGDPAPPRLYRLYVSGTNTILAGYSISSGSVTSHPIPVFGYEGKTLFFQANQAGSLTIQILTQTGNWRTYDSVSVSANTLSKYILTGDIVLARIIFTPSTYPATINEAEAVLR